MKKRMETRRSFLKAGLGAWLGAVILSRCGGADLVASGAATDGGTGTDTSGTSDGGSTVTDGGTSADCVLDPTTTKGPYWVDERLNRSDIRSDTNGVASPNPRPGLPLTLEFALSAYASGVCTPLQGAQVDIWHCDASGIYSDVQGSTAGQNFLRGYQVTDASGVARFTTIYPGWYSGRAVHIHVKVRLFDASNNTTTEATTQVFFEDTITDAVYKNVSAYSARSARDTRNASDNIYGNQTVLLLSLNGDTASGFTGTIPLGVRVGQVNTD
jgi:protocatechuate 3,4-dioxygenase beta subunit